MDFRTAFRNSLVTGLVLIAPLAVTVFVLQFVFRRLTALLDPIVQTTEIQAVAASDLLVAQALAALLVVSVITLLGFLAQRSSSTPGWTCSPSGSSPVTVPRRPTR